MDNAELMIKSENLTTKTRKSVSLADNVVILNDSVRASRSSEKSQQNLTDNGPSSSNASSKKTSRKTDSKRKIRRSTKSVHSIPSKNNNKVIKSNKRTSRTSTRNISVATLIETKDRSTSIDTLIVTNQNDSRLLASASSISDLQKNIWSQSSEEEEDNCFTQSKETSNNKIITNEVTDHSSETRFGSLSFIQNAFNKFKGKNSRVQNALNKTILNKGSISNFKKKMLRLLKSSGKSVTRDRSNSMIFDESNKDSFGMEMRTENDKVPIKILYQNEKSFKEVEQLMCALLNEIEEKDIRMTKSTPFTDNEPNLADSCKNDTFEQILRKERTWLVKRRTADKDLSNEKQNMAFCQPTLKVSLDFLKNRNEGHDNVSTETYSCNGELAGVKSESVHNIRSAARKCSLGSVLKKVSISSKKGSQITVQAKISGKNDYSKDHDVLLSSIPIQEINDDSKSLNRYENITKNMETKIRRVKSSTSEKSLKSVMKYSTMDISNNTMKVNSEQYYGYNVGLIQSDPIMTDVRRSKSLTNICLNTTLDSKNIKAQSDRYSNTSENEISVIDKAVIKNSKYQKSGQISETTILGKLFAAPYSKSGKKSKDKIMSGLYPWSPISDNISIAEKQQQFVKNKIIKPSSFKKFTKNEDSDQDEKFLHETKSMISDNSRERLKRDENEKTREKENFVSISPQTSSMGKFDFSTTDSAMFSPENVYRYTLPIENPVTKDIEIQENLGSIDLSNFKRLKNTSTNRSKNSLMALISRNSKSSKKSSANNMLDKSKTEKNDKILANMAFKEIKKLPEIATRKKRGWIKNSTENIQNKNKPLISTKDSEQTFKKTPSLLSRIFHSNRSTDKRIYDNCINSRYRTSNTTDSTVASNVVTLGENNLSKGYKKNDVTPHPATSTSKVFFDQNSVTQQLGRHSKSTGFKNMNQVKYMERSTASIFKRRSSLIMMAIPISNGNTASPITADSNEHCYYFYYFLGLPLDVALVDIATVLKQLIDKISNSRTDSPR